MIRIISTIFTISFVYVILSYYMKTWERPPSGQVAYISRDGCERAIGVYIENYACGSMFKGRQDNLCVYQVVCDAR